MCGMFFFGGLCRVVTGSRGFGLVVTCKWSPTVLFTSNVR